MSCSTKSVLSSGQEKIDLMTRNGKGTTFICVFNLKGELMTKHH